MIQFRLAKTQATNFSVQLYERDEAKKETDENSLQIDKLEVRVGVPENDKRNFAIAFDLVAFSNKEQKIEVAVEFWAYFKAEQDLTEEFLNGHFTSVNAPAIAFPFLRAFVANILMSANYPTLYLPTINFQAIAEKQSK